MKQAVYHLLEGEKAAQDGRYDVALDELNKPTAQLRGSELYWAEQSIAQPYQPMLAAPIAEVIWS